MKHRGDAADLLVYRCGLGLGEDRRDRRGNYL